MLFFLTVTPLYAGFDLTIEPEAGFQSNVPDGPTDSSFGNYPFCALGLEPSWTPDTGRRLQFIFTAPVNGTKYIGGSGEFSFNPTILLEKTAATHTTSGTFGVAYHYLPAAYDPTVPENFLELSLGCERAKTAVLPFTGIYEFSLLNDLATNRVDAKNSLQLKLSRNSSARIPAFIRLGCSLNFSTTKGAGYVQPLVAGGITIPFNERNLLLLQVFAAYSIYRPTEEPVQIITGKGRWEKKTDTLSTYTRTEPRIPFSSLYCGYDRELTQHINLHFYYLATFFGRGRPDSMLLSHQSGIIFSWYRK